MKLCIFLFLIFFQVQVQCQSKVIVRTQSIIHSNLSYNKTIYMSRFELQRIFTRKQLFWSDGSIISNIYIKPMMSIENQQFLLNFLQLTLYRYQQYLDTAVYSGKAMPVIEVKSDVEMLFYVNSHPNSIGYLNYEIVSSSKRIICDDC